MKDDLKAAVEQMNILLSGTSDKNIIRMGQTLITHATENEEEMEYNRQFFSLGAKEQRLKDLEKRQADMVEVLKGVRDGFNLVLDTVGSCHDCWELSANSEQKLFIDKQLSALNSIIEGK